MSFRFHSSDPAMASGRACWAYSAACTPLREQDFSAAHSAARASGRPRHVGATTITASALRDNSLTRGRQRR